MSRQWSERHIRELIERMGTGYDSAAYTVYVPQAIPMWQVYYNNPSYPYNAYTALCVPESAKNDQLTNREWLEANTTPEQLEWVMRDSWRYVWLVPIGNSSLSRPIVDIFTGDPVSMSSMGYPADGAPLSYRMLATVGASICYNRFNTRLENGLGEAPTVNVHPSFVSLGVLKDRDNTLTIPLIPVTLYFVDWQEYFGELSQLRMAPFGEESNAPAFPPSPSTSITGYICSAGAAFATAWRGNTGAKPRAVRPGIQWKNHSDLSAINGGTPETLWANQRDVYESVAGGTTAMALGGNSHDMYYQDLPQLFQTPYPHGIILIPKNANIPSNATGVVFETNHAAFVPFGETLHPYQYRE